MKDDRKISGADRRALILERLKESADPITGKSFAAEANVSRQVIVQDVSLLKAKDEPIVATSQGYIYLKQESEEAVYRHIIACNHTSEQTWEELTTIVDHGVRVSNVIIEHGVYGDLTASVRVSNRKEVDQFIQRVNETNAAYLLELTNGIHLHTLEADSMDKIEAACRDLEAKGILLQ
ncbi:transcriptional regulator of NAD metabolism [Virgibacillus natechei]|uniref:Transcriptional regulator of NAD metabolism n=1 Tax=Virgibacillus natechei TaxID=1216297 RepID=A0ABS4IE51_9BACI|nr:transcription repressor NadR [Virgibacillus natechei]MBP1969220.1 transcriptional regulator of NAD metabolism [Virgibacillus natechei]UZD12383.1 transcription repressor NadR [Virgibacillus natechei]